MQTLKTTYRKLIQFKRAADQWSNENTKPSKLSYAIGRVIKQNQHLLDEHEALLGAINIENCSTDSDGIVLTGPGGSFCFKKDALAKRNKAQLDLDNTEIEVEIYIATKLPELTILQAASFEGFVIPEQTEPT